MRGIVRSVVVAWVAFGTLGCGGKDSGAPGAGGPAAKLNGGGATFVQPIMQDWANEYEAVTKKKVVLDYQGSGSGTGVTQMTDSVLDFGCSDAPLTKSQLDAAQVKNGPVVHVPLVVGAVVVPYNLPELKQPLVLSGEVLAAIFTRQITQWNDPKVAALNPGAALPDRPIIVVVRADGSGTSNIFTEYLGKVDEAFRKAVPANSKPGWPKEFTAEPKSSGVINAVQKTPGAITYVEQSYAIDSKLAYATIRNTQGKDVVATLETVSQAAEAALAAGTQPEPYSLHTLTYSLTNPASPTAYPIAAMSYCVFYEKMPAEKKAALLGFLRWATTQGQAMAQQKHYAPLPKALQQKIEERLAGQDAK